MPTVNGFGKIDTDLQNITTELSQANPDYAFDPDFDSRERLRLQLRDMHAGQSHRENLDVKIHTISENSPLNKLLNEKDVGIFENGEILASDHPEYNTKNKKATILASDIKNAQENIQIYYDPAKITQREIEDIQILKMKGEVKPPANMDIDTYKNHLEEVGSYVVIRGEVKQYYTMSKANNINEQILDKPRDRVLYYANFPKLQGNQSNDVKKYVNNGKLQNEDGLKDKFKDVIRLQIIAAAANNEALDIVTPNAFFGALTPGDEQDKAKKLFARAVAEIATEKAPDGFKGLFIHNAPFRLLDEIEKFSSKIQTPLIVHDGDSSAPQLASRRGNNFKIAEAIMGEANGPAGNGALGDGGNKAKEENDSRQIGGAVQLTFNAAFNPKLLDMSFAKKVNLHNEKERESFPNPNLEAAKKKTNIIKDSIYVPVVQAAQEQINVPAETKQKLDKLLNLISDKNKLAEYLENATNKSFLKTGLIDAPKYDHNYTLILPTAAGFTPKQALALGLNVNKKMNARYSGKGEPNSVKIKYEDLVNFTKLLAEKNPDFAKLVENDLAELSLPDLNNNNITSERKSNSLQSADKAVQNLLVEAADNGKFGKYIIKAFGQEFTRNGVGPDKYGKNGETSLNSNGDLVIPMAGNDAKQALKKDLAKAGIAAEVSGMRVPNILTIKKEDLGKFVDILADKNPELAHLKKVESPAVSDKKPMNEQSNAKQGQGNKIESLLVEAADNGKFGKYIIKAFGQEFTRNGVGPDRYGKNGETSLNSNGDLVIPMAGNDAKQALKKDLAKVGIAAEVSGMRVPNILTIKKEDLGKFANILADKNPELAHLKKVGSPAVSDKKPINEDLKSELDQVRKLAQTINIHPRSNSNSHGNKKSNERNFDRG